MFIKLLILFISLCTQNINGLIDPFSVATIAGLGALGYNFETVKKYTYCQLSECCLDDYIPNNINGLESDLRRNLFGQHIVISQLIPALRGHLSKHSHPKKPLALSFHGTPGTGKNYVADFIAKNLYKRGLDSNYVHKFMGRADFPVESKVAEYKVQLKEKVHAAIKSCSRSIFIFDEVNKMPAGVFDGLISLLDHHEHIYGIDFRPAIFIFLSNTAGVEIANRLGDLLKNGVWRHDTKLHDFEKILESKSFNMDGGFKKTGLIESSLIDHYIPFLPLEKDHIRSCIAEEFKRWGKTFSDEQVEKIIANSVTFDKNVGIFATSGCKRLSKKVEIEVHKVR